MRDHAAFCLFISVPRVQGAHTVAILVVGTEAGDQRTLGASAQLLSRHCGTKLLRNTRNVSEVLVRR